jgi:hypothetical protein
MARYKVGYMVGSLATASINRMLAKALIRLAPPDLEFVEIRSRTSRCTATTTTPTTRPRAGRSRAPSPPWTPCCS